MHHHRQASEDTFHELVLSFHGGLWGTELPDEARRAVTVELFHWLKAPALEVCFSIHKPGLHSRSIY